MSQSPTNRTQLALKYLLAFLPWLLSMYALYFLETQAVWNTATPYRDLMTVIILGTGMLLSFLVYSYLFRESQHRD